MSEGSGSAMNEEPPEEDKPDDAAFHQALKRMLGTPPKPHKAPESPQAQPRKTTRKA